MDLTEIMIFSMFAISGYYVKEHKHDISGMG